MSETDTLDLTTDEALLSSLAEHKVEELKLEPYSLLRQVIAVDLIDRNSGTFFSAAMTVWVCTLSEDEALDAHAGERKEAQKRAFRWAESRGYNYYNWRPLVDIYLRIQREWDAVAKAHLKPNDLSGSNGDEDEVPNAGGQPV